MNKVGYQHLQDNYVKSHRVVLFAIMLRFVDRRGHFGHMSDAITLPSPGPDIQKLQREDDVQT